MVFTFSDRIKDLRLNNRLTQKEFAVLFNLSERQYQNYEIGKSFPNFHTLIKLADYFDVSIDYLVGRSNDPKRY